TDGRASQLYLDPSGAVERVKDWAAYLCTFAGLTERRGLAPLVLSGLIKTGKSYSQQEMVPAAVSAVLREQPSDCALAGITVLHLQGDKLTRQEGAGVLVYSLLEALVRWARDGNVPVAEAAWQEAQGLLAAPAGSVFYGTAGNTVISFLHAVKVPVLVLFDELQSFLQPTVDKELHAAGAEYIRDVLLKQLLVYGPRTCCWCLTGSGMALTWMSLAAMPSNGFALLSMVNQVDLPATYPQQHMQLVRSRLMTKYALGRAPGLDTRLLEWSETSPALVTVLLADWAGAGRPKNVDKFVSEFLVTKLVSESVKEWKLGLSGLSLEARSMVLDLAFAGVGTPIDFLDRGIQRFLAPHLETTDKGGMALTWMSLAAMPSNGFALFSMVNQVDLPATYPQQHMQLVRSRLMTKYALGRAPGLDTRLLEWSETSPALVTVLLADWAGAGRPKNVDKFVSEFLVTKLVSESVKEWKLGLSGLSLEARSMVLDLAFAGVGTPIDFLDRGIQRFLAPHLETTDKGLFYLKDDYQRQILRIIVNKDGSLRTDWGNLECSATLIQLDWGWTLLRLGEVADYLFGPRVQSRWVGKPKPAGSNGFRAVLESLANLVANKLPKDGSVASKWEAQVWFQEVLWSEWNSSDCSWYDKNKGLLLTNLDMLVFFL
ncbi:hypothetical protein TSOC_014360, partial [Tetrabaena socialis]